MMLAFQKMNGELPFDDDGQNLKEFEEICRPVAEYIQKKHHPYTRIIVEWDRACLVEDLCGVSFQVPD